MMSITEGKKLLDFNQTILCEECGKFGRFQVFMTYTVLSLFFIPVFRWNRRYFVETSCCHALFSLEDSVGEAIARGEQAVIRSEDIRKLRPGSSQAHKRCSLCGFETEEAYDFCPKCGNRLESVQNGKL